MASVKGRRVDTESRRGRAKLSQIAEPSSRDGEWHEVFQASSEAHASLRVFLYCHAALHEFWGRAALRLQSIGHHQPSSSLSARFDGAH